MINVLRPLGLLLLFLPLGKSFAQTAQPLTVEQCYQLAEANYPLTRQRALIEKTKEYNLDNIRKGVFPQFTVSGSATYQSDVTKVSLPPIPGSNFSVPSVSTDQYKLYGEA